MSLLHNLQCSKTRQMKPPAHFNPMVKNKGKPRLSDAETKQALKNYLIVASGGVYRETTCKYVQNEKGEFVLTEETEIEKD